MTILRTAYVYVRNIFAGKLCESDEGYTFTYDKAYLESIYKSGAERASYLANKTLRKVYKKVGFVAR